MLCAKYDYKMDIAVKQEEAVQRKGIEVVHNLHANGVSIEIIANSLNMTPEQVMEIISKSDK